MKKSHSPVLLTAVWKTTKLHERLEIGDVAKRLNEKKSFIRFAYGSLENHQTA